MTFGARIVKLPYRVTSICVAAGPVWSVFLYDAEIRLTRTQQIPGTLATHLHQVTSQTLTACHAPDLMSRAVQNGAVG